MLVYQRVTDLTGRKMWPEACLARHIEISGVNIPSSRAQPQGNMAKITPKLINFARRVEDETQKPTRPSKTTERFVIFWEGYLANLSLTKFVL